MTGPTLDAPSSRLAAGVGRASAWWGSRRQGSATPLLLFAGVFVLSVVYFLPSWSMGSSTTWPGHVGDPEQNQWFLAWVPYAIGHGIDPFVTHYVLYPSGVNLMWNTSELFPALVVSPITVLFGPTVAYNVVLLLGPPTAAVAAYAALRRWASPPSAAVGGLLFGFSPFFVRQAQDHLHLSVLAFVPLMLLMFDEVFIRQRWARWKTGLLLGLVALAQYFTATELFALDALVAGIALVILAVVYRNLVASKVRYAFAALGIGAAVFVVLAAYPLWVQFRGPLRVPQTIHAPDVYVNDLANVVTPVGDWLSVGTQHGLVQSWTGNAGEWNGYLGFPLILLCIAAMALYRRRAVVWLSFTLLVVVEVLSLGPSLHVGGHGGRTPLPWRLVTHLPFMNNALPNRLAVYTDLLAALLVAVLIDGVLRRRVPAQRAVGSGAWGHSSQPGGLSRFDWLRRRQLRWSYLRWGRVAVGVGVILAVLAWVPTGPDVTTVGQPAYFAAGGEVNQVPHGTVAVVLPWVQGPGTEHAELWQARAGMPVRMPEGYMIVPGLHYGEPGPTYEAFANISAGVPQASPTLSTSLATAVRQEWRGWGVQLVVVGPGYYDQRMVTAMVTQVLGGMQPRWTGGVAVFDLS